ncbi:hypothetical protein J6590_079441 [Homalodisca vitripennis]|nr:hypothetical protein J6590_079441 [Homalodisca vitripennis]
MISPNAAKKLSTISLSENSVGRRITGLVENKVAENYIPVDQCTVWNWVRSLFTAILNPLIHDKLTELSWDKTLQLSFSTQDVGKF